MVRAENERLLLSHDEDIGTNLVQERGGDTKRGPIERTVNGAAGTSAEKTVKGWVVKHGINDPARSLLEQENLFDGAHQVQRAETSAHSSPQPQTAKPPGSALQKRRPGAFARGFLLSGLQEGTGGGDKGKNAAACNALGNVDGNSSKTQKDAIRNGGVGGSGGERGSRRDLWVKKKDVAAEDDVNPASDDYLTPPNSDEDWVIEGSTSCCEDPRGVSHGCAGEECFPLSVGGRVQANRGTRGAGSGSVVGVASSAAKGEAG
ncbi:unnamed protein product, partial [Discosporangium mesarthrocarpum]